MRTHIQWSTSPVFALLVGACSVVAFSSPVAVRPAAAGPSFQVHDASTVLETRVSGTGDQLSFVDRSGRHWNLVTSIEDPIIAHKGSGEFHAASTGQVMSALEAVSFPGIEQLGLEVFLLPYPRRECLPSSAHDGAIYLSPGVYPYASDPLHSLVVHELGHVVHQVLLPDWDTAGWARYRELRGLTNTAVYNNQAAHRNRPREIFAEDFRALFGGAAANYSGSIENGDIPHPTLVPGLAEFFLGLIQTASVEAALPAAAPVASPNPFVDATTLSFAGVALLPGTDVEIIDVAGRLVRHLDPAEGFGDGKVGWNGRDEQGRRVSAGVYFAVVRSVGGRLVTRLVVAR